jgi:hypothetical protein
LKQLTHRQLAAVPVVCAVHGSRGAATRQFGRGS